METSKMELKLLQKNLCRIATEKDAALLYNWVSIRQKYLCTVPVLAHIIVLEC